jgi:hypothetical protein
MPSIEREQLTWHPDGARAACTITLAGLFRAV